MPGQPGTPKLCHATLLQQHRRQVQAWRYVLLPSNALGSGNTGQKRRLAGALVQQPGCQARLAQEAPQPLPGPQPSHTYFSGSHRPYRQQRR